MIESTFQHIPNILRKGEIRLWNSGITTWQKLINTSEKHPHFTRKMWQALKKECIECQQAWDQGNINYFLQHFPEEIHWRFFPNFVDQILYFDVEMTGLDIQNDKITTIVAFDGIKLHYFVRNKNLDEFPRLLEKFTAIATFDGIRTDIPFLEKEFEIHFDKIHFDLFSLSRLVRLSGGLKQIERILGIQRNLPEEMNGLMAIFLWNEYQATQDPQFLSTLLAYNAEDALHLQEILFLFYEKLRKFERIPEKKLEYSPKSIQLDNIASKDVLQIINLKYGSEFL
ncbi:hypothetical protein NEF87_004465 [Candidatus Lokiarchaeum ossiferum]|uniref:YprB ribonuclease H-like domain-containing protein n=1 Tax=Candidatus Lokiarchaeum ossiferum TaxID=2951803 RepID=A0ABY6HXE0_9ARCH|nr:hypothetical protein NEF87_004465 [Candidatus Lokiarchaeum sp. B-35]